jgi:hypothetical protein
MIIKARLAYGVILKAEISDGSPLRMLNVEMLLTQAANKLKPLIQNALTMGISQLAILGIRIETSDSRLDITAEP